MVNVIAIYSGFDSGLNSVWFMVLNSAVKTIIVHSAINSGFNSGT